MKIIGGRDYYDSALAYGHDEHTTFVRGGAFVADAEAKALGIEPARRVLELHPAAGRRGPSRFHLEHDAFTEVTVRGMHHQLNFTTVIACGKRYQGLRVASWTDDPSRARVAYHWTAAQLHAWLAENALWHETVRRGDDLDAWFGPAELPNAVLGNLIERGWTLLVNDPQGNWYGGGHASWKVDQPVLKEVELFRVVPPHLMFQEIDQWIGGRLSRAGAPMAQVSDEVRMAKHGMDKTSFRRPPRKR
jgi:hypothetical protein